MQLLRIDEPTAWDEIVSSFCEFDFFHSFEYHAQNARISGGQPVLYCLDDGIQRQAAFPFVLRPLEGGQFDLTSVYGYPGPLVRAGVDFSTLREQLFPALSQQGAIAAFFRFHPILNSQVPAEDGVQQLGDVVIVDLDQAGNMDGYRKTTRYEIRKLTKLGAAVDFGFNEDRLQQFTDLYYQNMDALQADPYYYFDREFLSSLFDHPLYSATIGRVQLDGEVIASAMFTSCGSIAEYYLGGALAQYAKLAPQKLLLHEAFQWAAHRGAKKMNLGGGRGSKEDGLYRFKRAFSDQILPFRIAKIIVNPEAYQERVRTYADQNQLDLKQLLLPNSYFPAYRRPVSI